MIIAPTQSAVQTVLRAFLLSVLPSGVEVIEGQDNRVPEPQGNDFVVMTTIRRERIETNNDVPTDCKFVGSVSGTTLTVTSVTRGAIAVGNTLSGVNVPNSVTITALGTGMGGVGTYTLSQSLSLSSQTLSAGFVSATQPTKVVVQLDFHSANVGDSADMAATVATLFRDEYATTFFDSNGVSGVVAPLYAEDPRQMPFMNAEQQWETRWIVDVAIQANQAALYPMQFMDNVFITIEPPYA
jgi:hypothetical protein